jgi:hypothetical protein
MSLMSRPPGGIKFRAGELLLLFTGRGDAAYELTQPFGAISHQEPPILAWVESVSAAEVVDSRRGRFTGCCNQRLIR